MKKFLALAFVCAGLTAMAVTPRVNNVNIADLTKKAGNGSMVMKSNTLAKSLTAGVMDVQAGKSQMSPKQFFSSRNLTPGDNALLKRAPRRVTADDIANAEYLDFRYVLTFGEDGYLTQADPYYVGGQGVFFANEDGQLYAAGLYWNLMGKGEWLPLNVDYTTNEVSLNTGIIVDDTTMVGNVSSVGTSKVRVDTVMFGVLVNEQYFYGATTNDPVTGTLYEDGSIAFNDSIGYAYWCSVKLQKYTKVGSSDWQLSEEDSTETIEIYRGNQFLVANGTHDYKFYSSSYPNGVADNNNVYMFQDAMGTVSVWNLWGFGMPDCSMYVDEGGVMEFPDQAIYDIPDSQCYDSNGVMQGDGVIYNTTGTWENGAVSGLSAWGNVGTINENEINWDMTIPYNGHWIFGIAFGDNKLTYKNSADKFNVAMAAAPVIDYTVNTDDVTIKASSSEENAVVLFMVDGASVENPYTVERRDTAYTVVALAGAFVPYEKNLSTTRLEIEIPAKATILRGDVNRDGQVSISDVPALIDALLSNNLDDTDTFSYENANFNGDDTLDIVDATDLIDWLLSGTDN